MATKKFGTFGGVFTPSILTILGVIMYMRLGWVVGNAGIIGAVILIVVAHVISVTTGLSISSIATDKKVGAGGVYYVLSRSLGLPIGGAIGVTLWVATALSIALYLVGFAESFNAYLGFDTSINGLRIAGSIALLALASIAIISTSFAIKTQYFIMAAIGISLVSIFAGTWEFAPAEVPSFGPEGGLSMMTIFAILFPAVTGFTAGIAMSGDLADPKKSIPGGTIAAIGVGFIVYLGLAVFMAYAINPELLRTDYNVLMKIALFAPAVVAGIWGATLSSALGGILGGPRILQAMSIDRITPKIFGNGVGKDNEPRNALLITLLIAEGGVLIGELDMIAEVCSMFYLAAYGFINLSFFLESWASADFTPTFKVKRWIGLLGFVATFAVMFQLNAGAMVAAFVVIGGIYAYLQRKQLALSSGDVWTSVWSSLVMKGLKRMDATDDNTRNWKPNILLFSGGTEYRPYLIEISKAIAGNVGMVSNFDLIENPDAEVLFPKHKQSVHDSVLQEYGIFGRKQEVKNVFQGIETIASTYGFSGVEPNTVMLGWAKNTKDPIWFTQMTQKLIALDYNVLFLDYDLDRKFGKYQQIDIWWQNLKNNAELTLNLAKFISRSPKWQKAKIRIILINDTSKEGFERRIHKLLDEYRIEATVKVINNHLLQRTSYELMTNESQDADLILAGIPEIPEGHERDFVDKTTEMFKSIATTLLVKTSSTLGEDIGQRKADSPEGFDYKATLPLENIISLPAIEAENGLEVFSVLSSEVEKLSSDILEVEMASFENVYLGLVNDCRKSALELSEGADSWSQESCRVQLFEAYQKRIDAFQIEDVSYLQERLIALSKRLMDFPEIIIPQLARRIKINGKKKAFRRLVKHAFERQYLDEIKQMQLQIGLASAVINEQLKDGLINTEKAFSSNTENVESHRQLVKKSFDELASHISYSNRSLQITIQNKGREFLGVIFNLLTDKKFVLKESKKYTKKERKALKEIIISHPQFWQRNTQLLTSKLSIDIKLHRIQLIIEQLGVQVEEEVNRSMFNVSKDRIEKALEWYQSLENNTPFDPTEIPEVNHALTHDDIRVQSLLTGVSEAGQGLPEQLELMEPESLNELAFVQGEDVVSITIDSLSSYYHLLTEVLDSPVQKHLSSAYQSNMEVLSKIQYDINQISQKATLQKELANQTQIKALAVRAKEKLFFLQADLYADETKLSQSLADKINMANGSLNTSSLLDHAVRVLPTSQSNRAKRGLGRWIGYVGEKINSAVNRFTDIFSGAEVSEEFMSDGSAANNSSIDVHQALRKYSDSLKLKDEIKDQVPFYYKQLFIGRQAPALKNVLHREKDVDTAMRILNSQQGQSSNLVVLGAPLSGKSFFAESVAKELVQHNVVKIQAPVGGSTSFSDLKRTLKKQSGGNIDERTGLRVDLSGIIYLIEDLELWWNRSDPNNFALKYIIDLINESDEKCRFILTCNKYAFHIMESQGLLDGLNAPRLELENMNRADLGDVLFERHRAGGLHLMLNGKDGSLSTKDMRKLSDRYLELSLGDVGVALHQWLNNIESCNSDEVEIKIPVIPPAIKFQNKEWLVIISQFIIHKHVDAQRLQKIFSYDDKSKAERVIKQLHADGVIEDVIGSTFRLNPLLQTVFIQEAESCGLI